MPNAENYASPGRKTELAAVLWSFRNRRGRQSIKGSLGDRRAAGALAAAIDVASVAVVEVDCPSRLPWHFANCRFAYCLG
jgi:hypothetical protein